MTDNGIPDDHLVSPATAAQHDDVARILGDAFAEDPVFNWFCQAEPSFYAHFFHSELQHLYQYHQHVFINRTRTGAAMWLPPGVSTDQPFRFSDLKIMFGILKRGGLKALRRGNHVESVMQAAHKQEPHYYLHAIGAARGYQGRGIGSALLKHGVRVCDEAGFPAYLESSNIRNNPLYERFGFEIIDELTLPEGGPSIWLMERSPA